MQAFGNPKKVVLALLLSFFAWSCQRQDAFDTAIAKHRSTLVDQVNPVGEGAPFFTMTTLNPVWQETPQTPLVRIPDFQLRDQDDRPRDASLFDEQITIVGFIFASCSGFCPFLVEGMKKVEREMKKTGIAVRFVAFTVNPEEDSPEKLAVYAKAKNLDTTNSWTLLTGDKPTIYSLAKGTFASQAFRRPGAEGSFVHSEHLYVIDGQRRLRGILNGTRVNIAEQVRSLLQKKF